MKQLITFILILFFFSSCKTLVPFTENIRQKNQLTTEDLKHVQFYLSDEVNLVREVSGNQNQVVSGKIKTINNKQIEEVLIPEKTKGVVIDTSTKGNIKVSFSDDEHSLTFGPDKKTTRYVILAEAWDGSSGNVHYGGDVYRTRGLSYDACLLVNLKQLLKTHHSVRIEKGRKL